MEAAAAEPCDAAADAAVPAGWRCANPACRATTASKRRGPCREFCSKSKCKELAALASAALKEDAKDKRIAELEQQLREQATTIALLKQELARARAAPIRSVEAASLSNVAAAASIKARPALLQTQPLASKAAAAAAPQKQVGTAAPSVLPPTAGAAAEPLSTTAGTAASGIRRPLSALSLNGQDAVQPPPAKKDKPSQPTATLEPPAAEPTAKAWEQCGWSVRPSRSRPDECTWVHEELGLALRKAPRVSHSSTGWHVSLTLVKAIIDSFVRVEQRPMKMEELYADFEACVPLKEGAVSRSKSLRSALRAATDEAVSQMEVSDCAALCEWLEGAPDAPAGHSLRDAAAALGWTEYRARDVAGMLVAQGDIYSTIDHDHFAIADHVPVSPLESPPPTPADAHELCV